MTITICNFVIWREKKKKNERNIEDHWIDHNFHSQHNSHDTTFTHKTNNYVKTRNEINRFAILHRRKTSNLEISTPLGFVSNDNNNNALGHKLAHNLTRANNRFRN